MIEKILDINGKYERKKIIIEEEEHPVLDEKLLNPDSLRELEYKLIPLYVWTIEKKNAGAAKLYDFSVWGQDMIRWMYSTKVIAWNEIVCEVMGGAIANSQ